MRNQPDGPHLANRAEARYSHQSKPAISKLDESFL